MKIDEEILDQFTDFAATIPRRELEAAISQFRTVNSHHNSTGEGLYIPYNVGLKAYLHVLDNGSKPREAVQHAIAELNANPELIDSLNNKFFYAKQVVAQADSHPLQKRIKNNGVLDRGSLRSSRSVNQQLRRLNSYRSISERIDKLEESDNIKQKKIRELEAKLDLHDKQLETVESILNIATTWKEKASILKSRGFTRKEVADAVGKGYTTILRYWEGL